MSAERPPSIEMRVRRHLANQCDTPLGGSVEVRALRLREDLGLDSLQQLALLHDVEAELGVWLGTGALEDCETLGDVIDSLAAHLPQVPPR